MDAGELGRRALPPVAWQWRMEAPPSSVRSATWFLGVLAALMAVNTVIRGAMVGSVDPVVSTLAWADALLSVVIVAALAGSAVAVSRGFRVGLAGAVIAVSVTLAIYVGFGIAWLVQGDGPTLGIGVLPASVVALVQVCARDTRAFLIRRLGGALPRVL
ncbi:hypothetical protein [Cellulosimicrobium cellulans]|uniref:hypothetical protein n=1 Tax=Cellulosimicrobium cellulans TaxID=1710 RepID=UPI0024068C16|nr:hypothetical protein [Cellulosimicrobium cellulans]